MHTASSANRNACGLCRVDSQRVAPRSQWMRNVVQAALHHAGHGWESGRGGYEAALAPAPQRDGLVEAHGVGAASTWQLSRRPGCLSPSSPSNGFAAGNAFVPNDRLDTQEGGGI